MKKTRNSIVAYLLAVLLLLGCISTQVFAGNRTGQYSPHHIEMMRANGDNDSNSDKERVDAIAIAYTSKKGTLRPKFQQDKNILPIIKEQLKQKISDMDLTDVEPVISSPDEKEHIKQDGTIQYVNRDDLSKTGVNSENVDFKIQFKLRDAVSEPVDLRATIVWDQDHYNGKIKSEADNFDFHKALGESVNPNEIKDNFQITQYITGSARTSWSQIKWSTDHDEIFTVTKPDFNNNVTFEFKQPKKDTEVKLIATFIANDSNLNRYGDVEKVTDFASEVREYTVKVKGTGEKETTAEDLLALLDEYYLPENIKYSADKSNVDFTQVIGDLQLQMYTRIKDENKKQVFQNKEIEVTSDTPALNVNYYRVNVDRFASAEQLNGNLIVKFTRDGITVEKKIPVQIKPVTEEELKDELKMMEVAKEHFFDGINDGKNKDKDHVIENLHNFKEMTVDENGNPVWVYNAKEMTNKGIIPNFFTPSSELESTGYSSFKSSNPKAISHDFMRVTRQENSQEVTISSLLSSDKYRHAAEKHPENELLQKLYKQPVEVTVVVKGTTPSTEALEKKIKEGEELLATIVEGDKPNQYPAGSKQPLADQLALAKATLSNKQATEEEIEEAAIQLDKVIKTTRDKANPQLVKITIVAQDQENAYSKHSGSYEVLSTEAAKYGYVKPEAYKNQVTVSDALVAYHRAVYGDQFETNPKQYLDIASSGLISKIFGIDTINLGYKINHKMPTYPDNPALGSLANDSVLQEGDVFNIFLYIGNYAKIKYLYFDQKAYSEDAGNTLKVKVLTGQPNMSMDQSKEFPVENATVVAKKGDQILAQDVTDKDGVAEIQLPANMKDDYELTVSELKVDGGGEVQFIAPYAMLTVKEKAVDKTDLETAINKANELIKADAVSTDGKDVDKDKTWVTEDTQKALDEALAAAKAVVANGNATQEEVENALTALNTAIASYNPQPGTKADAVTPPAVNKAELAETINVAKAHIVASSIDGRDIEPSKTWTSPEALNLFLTAITKAENVLRDMAASQAQIDQAIKDVTIATRNYDSMKRIGAKESARWNDGYVPAFRPIITRPDPVKPETKPEVKPNLQPQPVPHFIDTPGHWAEHVINYVVEKGYFKGTGPDTFSPNRTSTRAELITVLGRIAGINPNDYKTSALPDIQPGTFYDGYANWAVSVGIIKGNERGEFEPNREITREEVAAILARYFAYIGKNQPASGKHTYQDQNDISPWARDAVDQLTEAGILKGQGENTFAPQKDITRAEIAQLIYNMDQKAMLK